mgnify:CR=1 FL=1
MAYENGLTHFDESGQAIMVDVSEKKETSRTAIASGRIRVNKAVYEAIEQGTAKKGDVLGTARIAGIMAAKNTSSVIPLCPKYALSKHVPPSRSRGRRASRWRHSTPSASPS